MSGEYPVSEMTWHRVPDPPRLDVGDLVTVVLPDGEERTYRVADRTPVGHEVRISLRAEPAQQPGRVRTFTRAGEPPYWFLASSDVERCDARHPDAQPWDDNDALCWLTAEHEGYQHRALIPSPCPSCKGVTVHSQTCPDYERTASDEAWREWADG